MIVALTHGAGSDVNSPVLQAASAALHGAGHTPVLYDLPYRVERPQGPPRAGDPERDREGIRKMLVELRAEFPGEVLLAGGHSYGGRQTSMLVAEHPELADGLLLLSYPLHPPRQREQLRTGHFPRLTTPALFVHGSRDPFGLPDEMRAALELIPAPTRLLLIEGAGHELKGLQGMAEAVEEFFDAAS